MRQRLFSPQGRLLLIIGVLLAVTVVCIIDNRVYESQADAEDRAYEMRMRADIKADAFEALLAVRNGNLEWIRYVLWNKQGDYVILLKRPDRFQKILRHSQIALGLKKASLTDIEDSIRVKRITRTFFASLMVLEAVQTNVELKKDAEVVAVVYRINDRDMMSSMVYQDGKWRMVGLPGMKASALNYRTVFEASKNNDLLAFD